MSVNSQSAMHKKLLLSLGTLILGGSVLLGFSSKAFAVDIQAGPIWNNTDAQDKCPVAVQPYGVSWNGHWTTIVEGKMSVCKTNETSLPEIKLPGDVKAGPIWNNQDAKSKCPIVAAAVNGVWTGQWTTTVYGRMSVCGIKPAQ
ncbi:MAG: mannan-binding lectin [Pseudanabaena sp. ELA607]|jgi:hypothetical protein